MGHCSEILKIDKYPGNVRPDLARGECLYKVLNLNYLFTWGNSVISWIWLNFFYLSDVLIVNLLGSALMPPMILGGPFLVGPPLDLGLFVCLLFSVFVSRYLI